MPHDHLRPMILRHDQEAVEALVAGEIEAWLSGEMEDPCALCGGTGEVLAEPVNPYQRAFWRSCPECCG